MTEPAYDGAVSPTTLSISAQDLSDAGLEPQLRSWIGSGANEPITGDQITAVVGEDRLARTAAAVGREPGELAAALAVDLPRVVDTASPDGRVEPIRARVATTTFNGVTVAAPQRVVDDAESTIETQATLVIAADNSANSQNGLYSANFTVVFDAVPRV